MLTEIGLIVGLFILTQLVPVDRPRIAKPLRWMALIITLVVIFDLGLRSISQHSLATLAKSLFEKSKDKPDGAVSDAKTPAVTPPDLKISILRGDGGSITTPLGHGIAVAKGSSLRREWITINDERLPVRFDAVTGISTVYASERYSGRYEYRTKLKLVAREPISAIQVRYLTFDVWGEHVRTLSFEEVEDISTGPTKEFSGVWNVYSENDVERHYASIAYIARVRMKTGRVITADATAALQEAKKFSQKFTAADLEPPKSKEPEKSGK